jgi:leucyl aminopeptidase
MLDEKHFFANDIIHSYSGTSIEIIDTDAEGRLVLADGISYMIKITNQNILSISLHLPVVVLVHWVMNVALCLPIMKLSLKLQDAGDSVGAPMAITALGCL